MSSGARSALGDLFFYAPIGLVLDAQQVTPELAERGRRQVKAARLIGEMAVRRGWGNLDEILDAVAEGLDGLTEPPAPEPGASEPAAEPARAESRREDEPRVELLAIPGYDTLAASQIVKRLGALSGTELESVRLYEELNRARRTILSKIARLQAS